MASGFARGAKARGKRIAFGDGQRIIWDQHSEEIFRGNPNVAKPGCERDADIEFVPFYKGNRLYNRQQGNRWIWNYEFKAIPGEMFFDETEKRNSLRYGKGFILIEPHVPYWKSSAVNKDWGFENYQAVTDRLKAQGYTVAQFKSRSGDRMLEGVEKLRSMSFRDALGILSHARMYIGPEGGLHHGAAAVGVPAVVIFGGFIPPQVTGYDFHKNLAGSDEFCGSLKPCSHCKEALARITPDLVCEEAIEGL